MRRSTIILAVVALTLLSAAGALLVTAYPASAASPLSAAEAADVQYVREEEKLARDVYTVLDARYGDQVSTFENIARSESRHTLAIRDLLVRYGVEDPAAIDIPGAFHNEELQELFDDLVAWGSISLRDSLLVGVAIEELDIADLTACLGRTTHRDVANVYANLIDGSISHLAAFEKVLAR